MSVIPVLKNGASYAIFLCDQPEVKDAKFFTQPTDEFQVGVFERPAGYEVKAHMHPSLERTIHYQSEFLLVQHGLIKVTVFDEEWNELAMQELKAGDAAILLKGGHKVVMLEPTRLIEVKQGPYPGDDKAKKLKS